MKHFYLLVFLFIISFLTLLPQYSKAQCVQATSNFANHPAPTSSSFTTTTTCHFGGEYANITGCVAGYIYEYTTCGDIDFDTQLTVRDGFGGPVLAYNDDACGGLQSTVSWQQPTNGTAVISIHEYNCSSNSTCMTLQARRVCEAGYEVAQETNPVFTAASGCSNGSILVGGGAWRDITVAPNTYYNWVAPGSFPANVNQYRIRPINGSGSSGTVTLGAGASNNGWFSGLTTTVRVSTNRTSCTWNTTSAILAYRHSQPVAGNTSVNPSSSCEGGTATFTASSFSIGDFDRFQYRWNGSGGFNNWGTTNPYDWTTHNSSGSYLQVRARISNNGCYSYSSAVDHYVEADPSVTINGSNTTACQGFNPGTLTASGSGGTGGTSYQWRLNGSNISGATSSTYNPPALNTPGTYNYTVVYNRTGSGCGAATSNTRTYTIVADPSVSISGGGTTSGCVGLDPSTLSSSISGGTGSSSYQWQLNGSNISGATGSSYNPPALNSPGTYTYRVIHNRSGSDCGQATSNTITFNVSADPSSPTLNSKLPNAASVCEGTNVSATFNSGSGGTGCSDQYRVSTNGGSSWNSYSPGSNVSTSGLGGNQVLIQSRRLCSGNACDGSGEVYTTVASWNIDSDPGTANNTTSTGAICETQTKSLSASPSGGSWSIVSGGGSISGSTYTPANVSSNTSVTVRYTVSSNGACSGSSDDVTFTVNANPATANNTTDNSTLCEDVDRSLSGTPSGGAWSLIAGSGSISGSSYNTGSLSADETVTIRYTVSSNGACSGSTDDVSFTANSDNNTSSTWTGAVNSDWHNPENWSNCLPGNNTDVVIPSGPTNQPVVYANGTNMSNGLGECNTIEVQTGASITIKTNATLEVNNP